MADEILDSKEAKADESNVVRRQRANSFFYSVSDTFKFMAGVLSAAAMAIVLPAFASGIANGLSFGAAVAGLSVGAPAVGLALLASAAVVTAVAIGSQYIASRNYQTANLSALEINAKHTAKYLVKEMKQQNACIDEQPSRGDKKSWVKFVEQNKDQPDKQITLH